MAETTRPVPFGLWPSPVSPGQAARRLRLEDVRWSPDGQTLVWLESRPGGPVLAAQAGNDARKDLTDGHAPRGGVGYGGGAFTVGRAASSDGKEVSGSAVIFCDRDGRLYRVGLENDQPHPITPPYGAAASPVLSPDGRRVVYVHTDGSTDLLAVVPADGSDWPAQLAKGADFYMQPAWHPSGNWLAWVEWDNPHMPWDGSRVQLARLRDGLTHLEDIRTAAGGPGSPASQPAFSPDGRWLSFIEETGEWQDLVLIELDTGRRRILVQGSGFELALPAWVQGMSSYGWQDSSSVVYLRYAGPYTSMWAARLDTGESVQIDTAPYTWISQLSAAPSGSSAALIASAPGIPERIVEWDGSRLRVVARSGTEMLSPEAFSTPREFSWQAQDGTYVRGLYYPPSNPCCAGDGLPPAIIHVHSGPTSIAGSRFSGEIAYFTSRGYAWVELNYRGSTGYGRSYRTALLNNWGNLDVEDAAGCSQALIDQGLADGKRLVIHGSSAGGYTVLNTLIRYPGMFKAGICLYGVTNLFAMDLDTHKFEKYYNASLVGPLPAAAPKYRAWSPAFHSDRIQDPVYIFQGDSDRVAPPSQSEEVVTVLRRRGIPHRYKVYEGEGHGFRKPETIADYLQETENFLRQHVLFA